MTTGQLMSVCAALLFALPLDCTASEVEQADSFSQAQDWQQSADADTDARPYLPVKNSAEFAAMEGEPGFIAALNALKPCSSSNHRAFDFWIGEWEVTTPPREGWLAASSITVANDGCSIHEDYRAPSGLAGMSISFYDAAREVWHQTWMDNQGSALYLEGSVVDNAVIMSDADNRVTWSVQPNGVVRQHWETTADEGKTWTTAFDGYYRRVKPN